LVGDRTVIEVEKPSSTDGEFLFNCEYAIPVEDSEADPPQSGVGWAYRYGIVRALGPEPDEAGELYGPVVDSWEIEPGGTLFNVYGRDDRNENGLIGRFAGGGGGGATGCECCCETVPLPDTLLTDDVSTTSQRILCSQLQPITAMYSWGSVTMTFPAPASMVLVREETEDPDPPSDLFIWEMTLGVFTAKYADGTDATDDLVEPSGSVTFVHALPGDTYDCGCPQMRMRIEWDVTEPVPPVISGE